MNKTLLCVPAMVVFATPTWSQTAEETAAYILQEIGTVQETTGWQFSFGEKFLFFHAVDPEGTGRMLFFHQVDVSLQPSAAGWSLVAQDREGKGGIAIFKEADPKRYTILPRWYIANSANETKMRKLEKAFQHLSTLVTGRKDLF